METLEQPSLSEHRAELTKRLSSLRIEVATKEIDMLRDELQILLKKGEGEVEKNPQESPKELEKPLRVKMEPTKEEKVANLKAKFTRAYGEPSAEELQYLINRKEQRLIQLHKHIEAGVDTYGTDEEMHVMIGYFEGMLDATGIKTDVHGNAVKQQATYATTQEPGTSQGEPLSVDIELDKSGHGDHDKVFTESLSEQQAQSKKKEDGMETLKNAVFDARTNAVANTIRSLEEDLQNLKREQQAYDKQQSDANVKRFAGIRKLFSGRTQQPNTREDLEKRIRACSHQILIKRDQLNELHNDGFIELLPDVSDAEITIMLDDLQRREDLAYAHEEAYEQYKQAELQREDEKRMLFSKLTRQLDEIFARDDINSQKKEALQREFFDRFIALHPNMVNDLQDMGFEKTGTDSSQALPVKKTYEGAGKMFEESDTIVRIRESQVYLNKVLAERREKVLQAEREPKPTAVNPNERLFTRTAEVQSRLRHFADMIAANDPKTIDPHVTSLILIGKDIDHIKSQLEDALRRVEDAAQTNNDLKFKVNLSAAELRQRRAENVATILALDKEIRELTDKLTKAIAKQQKDLDIQIALLNKDKTSGIQGSTPGAYDFEPEIKAS